MRSVLKEIKVASVMLLLAGSALLAFGLYNVHSISNVTEGGILGLTLLLEYWFGISPSFSGFLLTALCYLLGWKILGKRFLAYSFISAIGFSVFYGIFEQFDPLFPQIAEMPFLASVVGALFVGISVGICAQSSTYRRRCSCYEFILCASCGYSVDLSGKRLDCASDFS